MNSVIIAGIVGAATIIVTSVGLVIYYDAIDNASYEQENYKD